MTRLYWMIAPLLLSVAVTLPAWTADRKPEDAEEGFLPMFNGKDLTGWVNVNCAPSTFFVRDGEIITTGHPTGYLRTDRQYENFIADFEWLHVNTKEVGNSGFFVWADPLPAIGTGYTRGIEVQVLVNLEKEGYYTSQGDLFSIWGAHCKPDRPHPHGWERCLPSENRCKGGGEWNHYTVIANDGTIKLHVNGKEVSGLSQCTPRKGYLALESEGAECHFRNLKIKELPSTHPKPSEVADEAQGYHNLYTGLDLSGWEAAEEARKHWQPRDWMLHFDGNSEAKDNALRTDREYGDAAFIVDCRFSPKKESPCTFVLRGGGERQVMLTLTPTGRLTMGERSEEVKNFKPAGQWNRLQWTLQGRSLKVAVNGKPLDDFADLPADVPGKGRLALQPAGEMDFANLFVRALP